MRAVELFCGAGGMSLGLKKAGIDIVCGFDAWQEAVAVYRTNVGSADVADLSNLLDIAPRLVALRPDLIAGGPPCQDYSTAGQRQEGDRAQLTVAYGMLISIVRPKWLVMENVPGVKVSKAWQLTEDILCNSGYGLTTEKLNAARYGAGQTRERLIVIGCLGEEHGFLTGSLLAAASAKPTTARDILGSSVGDTIYVHPRHTYKRRLWSSDEPAPTVRSTYARRVPPGYQPISNDAPSTSRPTELTRDQVSALQGFSPDYDWSPVTLSDRDQMVANAVPVSLAYAIGKVIFERHSGSTQPALEREFTTWLRSSGMAQSTIDDLRTKVNRARRMLGGRLFSDSAIELATLERLEEFQALPIKTQSALRVSLRKYKLFRQHLKDVSPKGTRSKTDNGSRQR